MPDSACYECYDCTEPFNTFRRRHHCRLCGQVFCAACCNQKLPGRIINCQGDLKVCTFCCKIILSYLHSPNIEAELTADMRALQVDLQSKFGSSESSVSVGPKKKTSGGYQEERFGVSRNSAYNISLSDPDRKDALRSSASLRVLYQELVRPGTGVTFSQHRYRLRCYVDVVLGTDIVHWLIERQKAGNRNQAHAICQALLDAEYMECPTDENSTEFLEHLLYQAKFKETTPETAIQTQTGRGNLPLSTSTFCLDLDVQGHSVYLSRPSATSTDYVSDLESPDVAQVPIVPADRSSVGSISTNPGLPEKYQSTETEIALWQSYKRHEDALLAQLLGAARLSYDQWAETVKRLCDEIVETIRPEESEDFEETQDIRQYVQFKKVPGGAKSDCEIVSGVACSKNASHREMRSRIRDPKILLLQCAIVYQRVEGRFFSLEPVMRQENDYIANVTARVLALQPDVVLVQRSVSRLAQELLRAGGVT
ncbi:putative 1-phosphatidylinositol 3-phosphate 5-kinase, partial [Ctenocephalides felis]|uniref:putative 1-phosphatidylinositol 3-phosphate 5-kinase n=1 Tax=Ctenocephalides felis TaxID=7515 RepID=UPI000E6E2709